MQKRHLFCILILLTFIGDVISANNYPWVKPEEWNKGLPKSVEIFTLNTTSSPFGTKLTGAYVKISMNDSNLELIVKDTNQDLLGYFPKTPEQYANLGLMYYYF